MIKKERISALFPHMDSRDVSFVVEELANKDIDNLDHINIIRVDHYPGVVYIAEAKKSGRIEIISNLDLFNPHERDLCSRYLQKTKREIIYNH